MSGTQAQAGQRITASFLNQNIPGPWLPITPQGAFSNPGAGNVLFQARQYNSVTLEVIGLLTVGSGANGTVAGTLPASLPKPTNFQVQFGIVTAGTGVSNNTCQVNCQTTGGMAIYGISGATQISLHFFISLDA